MSVAKNDSLFLFLAPCGIPSLSTSQSHIPTEASKVPLNLPKAETSFFLWQGPQETAFNRIETNGNTQKLHFCLIVLQFGKITLTACQRPLWPQAAKAVLREQGPFNGKLKAVCLVSTPSLAPFPPCLRH